MVDGIFVSAVMKVVHLWINKCDEGGMEMNDAARALAC